MKEVISVVSTFATDKLVRENGEVMAEQAGGPILFLETTLKKSNIPYQSFTGQPIDVEILITENGEFGKIPFQPPSLKLPVDELSSWVVISTLLREWDLSNCINYDGKLFVDIQGYVRDGEDFGKKRIWHEIVDFADHIFCLKGTKEEVSYLPSVIQEDQKKRLLIGTDGSRGVDIFYKGSHTFIPVRTTLASSNTIGAGDTFFGYFVGEMFKGADPVNAARVAVERTTFFLKDK